MGKRLKWQLPRVIRLDEIRNALGLTKPINDPMVYGRDFTITPHRMKNLKCRDCQLFINGRCTRPRKSHMTKDKRKTANSNSCCHIIKVGKVNFGWWQKIKRG